jgi:hypothetical protein
MARDVSNVEAAIVELSSGAASFGEGKGAEEKNKRGWGSAMCAATLPWSRAVRASSGSDVRHDAQAALAEQARRGGGVRLARGKKDNGFGPKRNSNISELFKYFQICLELIRLKHGLSLL